MSVELSIVADLYERGLYLQAYRAGQALGALGDWPGTAGRLLAGRLAGNLNAPRLARALHARAWREDPHSAEARCYYARTLLERRGPLRAWKFVNRDLELPGAPPELRAEWLAVAASIAALFRDFRPAHELLARADALSPSNAWLCVERATVLDREDRCAEALDVAQRSLELRPWFRPGVQLVAHLLQQLGRDQEALSFLTAAAERLESLFVVVQLADLQMELGDYAGARRNYERLADEFPVIEPKSAGWLAARRSNAAYHCGDFVESQRLAQESKDPFFEAVAQSLAAARGDERRVQLAVGFVRQHHMTCAPATLSAIGSFWSMPADHLDLAEELCYDGTPPFRERRWCEQHGWLAREFTVTWEASVALLDRGVPFTLTTVEPTSAHLQAVIGYDARRRTLLVRDPGARNHSEFTAGLLLARYRSTGPRGMALVPLGQADLLADVDLPDAALYDQLYALQGALEVHDRDAARAVCESLQASAPRHLLSLLGRRMLATYDADPTALLTCAEGLLELYPDDAIHELTKLSCLRQLARREERLAFLERVGARPLADPVFLQQQAEELAGDARQHEAINRLLSRALRLRPWEAMNYWLLGNLLWDQRQFAAALPMYRFAACLGETQEQFAWAYFTATRHLRKTDEGLDFLRARFERLGRKSGWPGRTLFSAYAELDRGSEAFDVLDEALRVLPDDGELLLFAADAYARRGELERCELLLAAARPKVRLAAWLRTAAGVARRRGDLNHALGQWQGVLDHEPLAIDAHRSIALLLAETQGREAAIAHLEQAAAKFPHSYALHQQWIEWLRDGDPARSERVLRRLVEIDPIDAWTQRELALVLASQQRLDEALSAAERSCQLDPTSPLSLSTRGYVHGLRGSKAAASDDYRASLRISIDDEYAMRRLLELCDTSSERREALRFVHEQLVRQVNFGQGVLAFYDLAQGTYAAGELLTVLRSGLAARPDLWSVWSAVVRQLEMMRRHDEALELARQATDRFPLLPGAWADLATVHEARKDHAEAVTALSRALEINPSWGQAARQLAQILANRGESSRAVEILEQAVDRTPLDAANHGLLADVLWRMDRRDAACERIEKALSLEPDYEWAWTRLRAWCGEVGRPGRAVELARELTARRPGDARAWLALADSLVLPAESKERLAALDRATALHPRWLEPHDRRADLLADAGRFREAQAACRPAVFGKAPPVPLRGRAAWVVDRSGNRGKAVKQMRRLVAENPDYYWGWSQLTMWYEQLGNLEGYREAAQALVRLAPKNPWSWGCLGESARRLGDRSDAERAFRRALELAPDYTFAATSLVDLLIEDRRLAEASKALAGSSPSASEEGFLLARRVRLELLRGDAQVAVDAFQAACECSTDSRWVLDSPIALLYEAGRERDVNRVLDQSLASPRKNPWLATAWVASLGRDERYAAMRRRFNPTQWSDESEWARSAAAAIEALQRAKLRAECRRFMRDFRAPLRRQALTWGACGWALVEGGANAKAIRWLADWRDRDDPTPSMLLNLALSYRRRGQNAEAAGVSQHATSLAPDQASSAHALWLASDDVCQGRVEEARSRLADFDPQSLTTYYQALYALVLGMIEADEEGSASRSLAAARRIFRARTKEYRAPIGRDCALARIRVRCRMRLATEFGGPLDRALARLGSRRARAAALAALIVALAATATIVFDWF